MFSFSTLSLVVWSIDTGRQGQVWIKSVYFHKMVTVLSAVHNLLHFQVPLCRWLEIRLWQIASYVWESVDILVSSKVTVWLIRKRQEPRGWAANTARSDCFWPCRSVAVAASVAWFDALDIALLWWFWLPLQIAKGLSCRREIHLGQKYRKMGFSSVWKRTF